MSEKVFLRGLGKRGIVVSVDLKDEIDTTKNSIESILKRQREFFAESGVDLSYIKTENPVENDNKIKEIQKLIVNLGFRIATEIKVEEIEVLKSKNNTIVLMQPMRAGNRFTYDGTIILKEDVHAGAVVEVAGSFICLGTIRGIVHAGLNDDESACVYASEIEAPQVKVKNVLFKNINEKNWFYVAK